MSLADSRKVKEFKIGKVLKRAREEAGLSPTELAKRANVDRTYVYLLEHDKRSPTLAIYFRICDALGMSPTELMGRIESGGGRR